MNELTIISGKGGTGKTSLVAAFASIASNAVFADCDVDAADLHLLLLPDIKEKHLFDGGLTAWIDPNLCISCDVCRELCRYDAIDENFQVNPFNCEGCGVCFDHCEAEAIQLTREKAGHWFVSATQRGPLVHARLGIAQDNSGKLVAQVRKRARELAAEQGLSLLVVDGPPGIGCPTISSITGANLVLAVTEPTQSGCHDLARVLALTEHFNIQTAVCVNKYDLNEELTAQIKALCIEKNVIFLGTIPYDTAVIKAIVQGTNLMDGDSPAAAAVRNIWNSATGILEKGKKK
jgi:MinD superfamily P-loop ATPase